MNFPKQKVLMAGVILAAAATEPLKFEWFALPLRHVDGSY